ncbi:MAG: riboflavin biosynthesis protein RibF [Cloacibacillus sp.]
MIYALGAFDGFHLGHRVLLETAAAVAQKQETGWGVITFEGHPRMLLDKNKFKLLFSPPERDLIAKYLAVPRMEKIHFTREFAALSPSDFVDCIGTKYSVKGLVTGANFRFGKDRAGNAELLASLCRERGWSLNVIPSRFLENKVISSTAVRAAVAGGDMTLAARLLGYPYMVSGRVAHGDGRGRELAFPTANLCLLPGKIYPPHGVYAAVTVIDGDWRASALNIGSNPTFDGLRPPRCEAHIIGAECDLYGRDITLFILKRLRGEEKFPSAAALCARVAEDVKQCGALCAEYLSQEGSEIKKFARYL